MLSRRGRLMRERRHSCSRRNAGAAGSDRHFWIGHGGRYYSACSGPMNYLTYGVVGWPATFSPPPWFERRKSAVLVAFLLHGVADDVEKSLKMPCNCGQRRGRLLSASVWVLPGVKAWTARRNPACGIQLPIDSDSVSPGSNPGSPATRSPCSFPYWRGPVRDGLSQIQCRCREGARRAAGSNLQKHSCYATERS